MVGMPRAAIASLMTYSRSIGPSAASPSPPRENRVRPDPLNWTSTSRPSGVRCSPSRMARPSPSMVKWPNWCPAYAWAIGREPAGSSWPANRAAAASGEQRAEVEAEFVRQPVVQDRHPRLPHPGRRGGGVEGGRQPRVGVLEPPAGGTRPRTTTSELTISSPSNVDSIRS